MARPSPDPAIPPDVLVAHAGFVRRLAFTLLRDDADADDAAQEALVRGLSTGPREGGARRAWLATVVRNVARRLRRGEGRHRARERASARLDRAESALDAAARQETLRAVVDAVGALEAPAREVVLLRHYDGLPPREIAARLGLPVGTVKNRLARAHAVLRVALDAEGPREGGRRRKALAGFAGIPLGPWGGTGGEGAVMAWSGKTGAVAAAVLLAAGVGAWVLARSASDTGDEVPRASEKPAQVATAPAPTLEGRRPAEAPSAPASAPPPAPPTPPAPKVPSSWIGHSHGRAAFRTPREWTDRSWDGSRVPDPPELCRFVGAVEGGGPLTWGAVPRKEADALAGTLSDATETPAVVGGRAATERRGRATVGGAAIRVRILRFATLDGFDEPVVFVATTPASAPASVDEALDLVRGTLTLTPFPRAVAAAMGDVPGDVIEVAVFLDGVPAAGTASLVQWLQGTAPTLDDDGSWHVEKRAGPRAPVAFSGVARFDGLAGEGAGGTTYEVLVQGPQVGAHRITTSVSRDASKAHPRLVLTLGPGVVRGRAFARDGRPAEHATVVFRAANGAFGPLMATSEATTDADGRYELRGLPLGHGLLWLELPPLDGMPQAARQECVDVRDATPVTLDFGDARRLPIWRGRVVDSGGGPVAGPGTLRLIRLVQTPGRSEWESALVARDARFEARVEAGRYRVSGEVVRASGPPRYVDSVEVEVLEGGLDRDLVVGGGTVVLRVRLANGDAAGQGLEFWLDRPGTARTVSFGAFTERDGRARFAGLPAGRYRVLHGRPFGQGPASAVLAEVDVADPPVPIEIDVLLPAEEGR